MPKASPEVIEFAAKEHVLNVARAMAFAPDGSLLTCCRHERHKGPTYFVRWDVEKRQIIQKVERPKPKEFNTSPEILQFAPDGKTFVTDQFSDAGGGLVGPDETPLLFELRDAGTLAVKRILDCCSETSVVCVDFSPDGRLFAASTAYGLARVWDLRKKARPKVIEGGGYRFVGFNAAGTFFGVDDVVFSMDPRTGAQKRIKPLPGAEAHALSPDRTLLVSVAKRELLCTDTRTWKTKSINMGKPSCPPPMVVAADNRHVAVAEKEGAVTVWDILDGEKLMTFKTSRGCLSSLAFSRDGKLLAGSNFYKIFVVKLDGAGAGQPSGHTTHAAAHSTFSKR